MNHEELTQQYITYFTTKYKSFITEKIQEIKTDKNPIDISVYTSQTVEKPKIITSEFLKFKGIDDYTLNIPNILSLKLSLYLEMRAFDDRIKLENELFKVIIDKITKQK